MYFDKTFVKVIGSKWNEKKKKHDKDIIVGTHTFNDGMSSKKFISLLDELSQDYIRTARSKGLSKYKVIVNHALINSLNPVITAISGWFASLLAGAVFVEQIFDWNGIGNELVSALKNDDFPLVIGVTIVVACFFVLINIIVDIVYGYLDPRVRLN